jgi:YspA, cpYpsA-related SLOG family
VKAAIGASLNAANRRALMTYDESTFLDFDPVEPGPSSPTADLCETLSLFGAHHHPDERDPRPLPAPEACEEALTGAVNALADLMAGTRLEDDLADLLWSFVNLFHRRLEHLERVLDDNELAQKRSQREQDFSEVKSVELERLVAQGTALLDRRDAFETLREQASHLYQAHTGSAWRPRSGSLVNRAKLTSAVVDSRDFINARRRAEAEVLVPKGTRVAFTGGLECNDHQAIWAALDKVRFKYPDMVLLHGGSPKGAEHIAHLWARERGATEVVFKPDWAKHRNAAPFKRNDQLLEALPVGVVVFPGNGVSANLADKAKKLGIPVMRFDRDA